MPELETKVKLLEKEIHDRKGVFQRLDIAIEKLTDVSNCINRMLAVHEEKRSEDGAEQKIAVGWQAGDLISENLVHKQQHKERGSDTKQLTVSRHGNSGDIWRPPGQQPED